MLTIGELAEHVGWARGKLAEDPTLGFKAALGLMRSELGVNAHPTTMRRWLDGLKPPVLDAAALAAYDGWGREKLSADPELGYRGLLRALEAEHKKTAHRTTMQRWLPKLRAGPAVAASPKPTSLRIGELEPYADWAKAKLAEDRELGAKALRAQLITEHGVTAADDTMRRWAEKLRPPLLPTCTIDQLGRYAGWARSILEAQPDIGYKAMLGRLQTEHHVTTARLFRPVV